MRDYKQELELFLKTYERMLIPLEREYKFHVTRKWRFDYAFPKLKIAFEYEGQAYQGGKSRHTTITGFKNDCEKYNEAVIAGWQVLRFTAEMIRSGMAYRQIEEVLK